MANDLTFGMDVVIDKILGLGQFDALGKKLQSVVAKAVEAGLLQGVPEARESLRAVYGKSDVASRNSALKRLYAYSAKVEADENKRIAKELAADARRAEREAASLAKAEAKQAERREKFEAAAAAYQLYSPYATTSATASYAESTIARQNLQYLTRITNRDLIDEEGLRSATTQQLIERSRANWEAKNIRYDLPYNRLAREVAEAERQSDRNAWRTTLQSDEALARQMFEAELGHSVSDATWAQIKYEEVFGASKAQAAWERGARRDAALEAERNAQRRKESAFNVGVFGEVADEAEAAAAELEALGKTAKITGLLFSGMSAGATMYYQSKWAQDVARNITASNMAYYQRWESGGQIAGGLVGAIAGALIGGPIGAIIGATGLGGLAGLWGNYKQKELEGVLKTVATTTGARRDYLMFRGASGFAMGQAMEDAGFGTASDLNNMRWTSQTLPGAMALGMVGEQDMLMLSLMPEYFAALMGGADAATLAAAYQKSVQNLPVQLRPLVATMAPGGSQGMYVNAIDPQFNNFLGYSYDMALKDKYFTAVSEHTMAGSIMRSQTNLALAHAGVAENYAQALQGLHGDYFDMSYISPMSGWAQTMTLMGANAPLSAKGAEEFFAQTTQMLNNEHFMTAIDGLSRFAENGLNLTIRVEGLGDVTQSFPFGALADGQSVEFNIGAQ